MDDITEKLRQLAMPSRNDSEYIPQDYELDAMLSSIQLKAERGDSDLLISFRKLRELATKRQIIDILFVKIYECSLYYCLDQGDLAGFSLCANRLVGDVYNVVESEHRDEVTCLLLLYFALDASRNADFASIFYRLPDNVRRSADVQYSLDIYMALTRCDYTFWAKLMECATNRQLRILKVQKAHQTI